MHTLIIHHLIEMCTLRCKTPYVRNKNSEQVLLD